MKRLLLTLLVTICAAIAFEGKAQSYKQHYQIQNTTPKYVFLATKSGVVANTLDESEKYLSDVMPSRDQKRPYFCLKESNINSGIQYCTNATSASLYVGTVSTKKYLSGLKSVDGYYRLKWTNGSNLLVSKLQANSIQNVQLSLKYDEDGLLYGVFSNSGKKYEYRYINENFYLVPQASEMPGERVYFVDLATALKYPINKTIEYSDGLRYTSSVDACYFTVNVGEKVNLDIFNKPDSVYEGIERVYGNIDIENIAEVKEYISFDKTTGSVTLLDNVGPET
ncbi:MAG: hypothetical protein K2M55_07120, partial [Muribaculaceae bacterium]|nr:hypothetical protein [Muribaculaceae bacterium]